MSSTAAAQPLPWWANFICAGLAACTAEITTLPVDASKVRLQLLRKAKDAAAPSVGMLGMTRQIVRDEGFSALYKGFWPAIHRQLVFASLRIGLYGQISAMFKKPEETTLPLAKKVLVGLVSGAIGITIANPTDLVKVRFQSEGKLAAGQKPRYSGVLNAYSTIVKQEGLRGLWTGLGPAIMRNSIINATELASYDTAKEILLQRFGLQDGLPTHFMCGAIAGFMATVIGNPIDVVKTRIMAAQKAVTTTVTPATGASTTAPLISPAAPVYTGAVDCIVQTMRREGPMAFYQGVVPQFFRITGWNIVMFITFEQLKAATHKSMYQ